MAAAGDEAQHDVVVDLVTDPFANVSGRGSVDYMLRTTQQQLVDLSGQADLKASIVMTTSALLTSISASRLDHESVRWALVCFMVGLIAAMFCAVLSVIPSFRTRLPAGQRPNPLFFGHFGAMPRDEYLAEMAEVTRTDATVYRAIVSDLHSSGRYLLHHKFRFLRLSYVLFLSAFLLAGLAQLVALLAG